MAEILDRLRGGERVDHYETARLRKDGATIAVSLTVSPIADAAGRITGASSIAHVDPEGQIREFLKLRRS
jgi:PAS domain S-box-containing protein